MSNEVATYDRVKSVASALRSAGKKVTADAIIENIGGSKATVLKHLKTLRAEAETPQTLPPVVMELAMPALAAIFEAGVKTEAERQNSHSVRQSRMMDELEAQVDELAAEGANLASQLESSQAELARAFEHYDSTLRELSAAREQIKKLEKEAQKDREDSAKRLSQLLAKMEAKYAKTDAA